MLRWRPWVAGLLLAAVIGLCGAAAVGATLFTFDRLILQTSHLQMTGEHSEAFLAQQVVPRVVPASKTATGRGRLLWLSDCTFRERVFLFTEHVMWVVLW